LSVQFFSKTDPVAAFLSTVAIFSVGFLIRPLGAFVFGRIGDLVGRKYTFLITLSGMGIPRPSSARAELREHRRRGGLHSFLSATHPGSVPRRRVRRRDHVRREHVPTKKRLLHRLAPDIPTLGIVVSLR